MPYFPQFTTGATSQFPCTKRIVQRTVVNSEASGGAVKLFDPGACTVEWAMQLSGLTVEEWAAIDTLFEAAEGRLGTFQFLDPFGNLLRWSESPSASAWMKDAGTQLAAGVSDPYGTARATRLTNTGASEAGLRQTADVPGQFQYCLSVWMRSDTLQNARLLMTAAGETASQVFRTDPAWRRYEFPMPLGVTAPSVTFGVALAAGAAVDVFGFQQRRRRGRPATSARPHGAGCSRRRDSWTMDCK